MNALITGVTSGFGKAIAFRLAGLGYNLVITGRRAERLNLLTQELIEKYTINILPLCFDVRDNEACTNAIKNLPVEFANIDLLINNAGLAAGASPFQDSDLADFEQMIDTNVKGLLYITKLIIPGMIARESGHIINISSISGIEVYPNGSVY